MRGRKLEGNSSKGLIKNGIAISIIVFWGKFLGFAKQAVIAWAFGANGATDIYFAADSFIAMLGQIQGASIGPSVLTQYVRLKEEGKNGTANQVVRAGYFFFPLLAILLIIITILFSREISISLGISCSELQRHELQKFLILLSPVILFTSLTGMAQGVLDGNNQFVPSKLLSLFFSLSIILSVLIFHKHYGILSMLFGFLTGYFLHTVYVTFQTHKIVRYKFVNPFKMREFNVVIRSFIPLVVGNSIVDLGHIIDKIIASSMEEGSVSYLYYSQVVSSDLVNAVIITTIGTILLPQLTRSVVSGMSKKNLVEDLNDILRVVFSLIIMVICLYFSAGEDMIRVFFERGNFNSTASGYVYGIVLCYAVGFGFIAYREILVKLHYAFQDTVAPMVNGILGVVLNLVLSIELSKIIGVYGIAIATTISIAVVGMLLTRSMKKHIGTLPINKITGICIIKLLIIGTVVTITGILFKSMLHVNFVIRMILVSTIIIILYLTLLYFFKERSIFKLARKIQR